MCMTNSSKFIGFDIKMLMYRFSFNGGDTRIKNEEVLEEADDENRCIEFLMLASLQLMLLVSTFCIVPSSFSTRFSKFSSPLVAFRSVYFKG